MKWRCLLVLYTNCNGSWYNALIVFLDETLHEEPQACSYSDLKLGFYGMIVVDLKWTGTVAIERERWLHWSEAHDLGCYQ